MRFWFSIVVAVLLALGGYSRVQAALIIGNLPGNDGGVYTLGNGTGFSIGFTMGATSYSLDSVTMRLQGSTAPAVAKLELRSSLGGQPATSALVDMGTQVASQTGPADYTFTQGAGFTLAAGTQYWLTLTTTEVAPNGLFMFADTTGVLTGPGAIFDDLFTGPPNDQSTRFPLNFGTPEFQINGNTGTAAVPEPSTCAILLALGAVSYRRRRCLPSVTS